MATNNGILESIKIEYPLHDVQDNVHYFIGCGADPQKAEELKIAEIIAITHRGTQQDETQLQQARQHLVSTRNAELKLQTLLNNDSYGGRSFGVLVFMLIVIVSISALGSMGIIDLLLATENKVIFWTGLLAVMFFGQPLTQPSTLSHTRKTIQNIFAPVLVGVGLFFMLKDNYAYLSLVVSGLTAVLCYHFLSEVRSILENITQAWHIFQTERDLRLTQRLILNLESKIASLSARLNVVQKGADNIKNYVKKIRETEELIGQYSSRKEG